MAGFFTAVGGLALGCGFGGGFLATGFEKPVYTISPAPAVLVVRLWVRCGLFEVWLPENWVRRCSLEASSRGTCGVFRGRVPKIAPMKPQPVSFPAMCCGVSAIFLQLLGL